MLWVLALVAVALIVVRWDVPSSSSDPGSSDPSGGTSEPPGEADPLDDPGSGSTFDTVSPDLCPYFGASGWMNVFSNGGKFGGTFHQYRPTYIGQCFPEERDMQASFLSNIIDDVRLVLDDPAVSEKFTDQEIIRLAGPSFRRVLRDVNTVSSRPYVCVFTVPVVVGTQRYELPPAIGEVLIMGEFDSDIDQYSWVNHPSSRYAAYRSGAWLEGRTVVLATKPTATYDLRIEYIPSGDFLPHEGARCFSSGTLDDITKTFALVEPVNESDSTKLLRGLIDARQNAYIGARIRIWNLAPQTASPREPEILEERTIISYVIDPTLVSQGSGSSRLVTVDTPWSTSIVENGTDVYQYEIVPIGAEGVRLVMMLGIAMTLAAAAGLSERRKLITEEYRMAIRNERLFDAFYSPYAQKFITDSRGAVSGGFQPGGRW